MLSKVKKQQSCKRVAQREAMQTICAVAKLSITQKVSF